MGKQAREERRQIERARRSAGPAAEVADRAEMGLVALADGITEIAAAQGLTVRDVNLGGFAKVRQRLLDRGHRWPSWCYLPVPLVGAALGEDVAIDRNPSLVSPATLFAALAGAWLPGRIAVRFDADLAAALMNTPMEGTIPVEVLQRLPAWCLYIDTVGVFPAKGFFVAMDAGAVEAAGRPPSGNPDELLVAIVGDGPSSPPLMLSTVWLFPGESIPDSFARQDAQRSEHGGSALDSSDDHWTAVFGMSQHDVLTRLLSLVLYLCSTEADTTQATVPTRAGRGGRAATGTVISAGFRIGAALRGARAFDGARSGGEASGRRVAPHLRRSHWHHYWCGSETRGDRRLELRWIPPVPVNTDSADDVLTVVRPAAPD